MAAAIVEKNGEGGNGEAALHSGDAASTIAADPVFRVAWSPFASG
jgi:hypothetical protein